MDKLMQHRFAVKSILQECVDFIGVQKGLSFHAVFDEEKDHYLLVMIGWDNGQRVYNTLIHLDIIENKVWVQNNETEFNLWEDFERYGVPKSEVIVGFIPEEHRQLATA